MTLVKSFIHGIKNTEDIILRQNGNNNIVGTSVTQKVEEQRVSKSLLKGEVTQEVEELRYRNYLIDRESKDFEYYTSTLALRRDKMDSKFVTFWNEDNLDLITIQPNYASDEGINSIKVNKEGVYKGYELLNGNTEYTIKIEREGFTPRYFIEKYTKKIAVRNIDETHDIIDFYVSKYPDENDFKSKGFVREIEKIRDEGIRSDVIDMKKIDFITSHAYRQNDMMSYSFDNISLKYINEFDGHYVVSVKGRILKNGDDLTKKYYNKTVADKYKNKAKKDIVLNPFTKEENKEYRCAHCGKIITYDTDDIDSLPIFNPDDIFENNLDKEKYPQATEYLDAQICEQTFGVILCHNCLKKYLNNKEDKTSNEKSTSLFND